MREQIIALLASIERMLAMPMPPVRRAELENLHRIWRGKLKN
jgi:hypothetical protein